MQMKILTLFLAMALAATVQAQSPSGQVPGRSPSGQVPGRSPSQTPEQQAPPFSTTQFPYQQYGNPIPENQPVQTTTNTLPADARNAQPGNNSTFDQTAPGDITTVNPMDPINDSRRAADSEMLRLQRRQNRAMAPTEPASGSMQVNPAY